MVGMIQGLVLADIVPVGCGRLDLRFRVLVRDQSAVGVAADRAGIQGLVDLPLQVQVLCSSLSFGFQVKAIESGHVVQGDELSAWAELVIVGKDIAFEVSGWLGELGLARSILRREQAIAACHLEALPGLLVSSLHLGRCLLSRLVVLAGLEAL